jgi:hypothetical protein
LKLTCTVALGFAALLAPAARANAVALDLGFISFDNVIPGAPGSPGINGFSIFNFTGDFALPDSFPSLTAVTFMNATLALSGPSPETLSLGDLAPGAYDPISLGVTFPDTVVFTSATLAATLSQTTLNLADGSLFTAPSPILTVVLSPSLPPDLTAGVDLALITVSTPEPKPASVVLLAMAVFVLWRLLQRVWGRV